MKPIHQDDPILTTYVLGETTPEETQRVQAAAEADPELSKALDSTAEFSEFIEDSLLATNNYRLSSSQLEEIRRHGEAGQSEARPQRRPQRINKKRLITLLTSAAAVLTVGVLVLHHTPVTSSASPHLSQNEAEHPALTELHIRIVSPLLQKPWPTSRQQQDARLSGNEPGSHLLPVAPPRAPKVKLGNGGLAQLDHSDYGHPADEADRMVADNDERAFKVMLQKDPSRFFEVMEAVAQKGELPMAGHLPPLVENVHMSASYSSQVPLTAGVASYPWLERFLLERKQLPPQSAIRTEELINHLDSYELGGQSGSSSSIESHGLRLTTELATCPWNEDCLLVAIQITNQNASQSATTTPLIRFRPIPEALGTYRLIGYASEANQENAPQSPEGELSDFTMPATLAAGATTVVLYEIQPTSAKASHLFSLDLLAQPDELNAGNTAQGSKVPLASLNVHANAPSWEKASPDYQLVSLIAATGLHLRDSMHLHDLTKRGLIRRMEALLDQNILRAEQAETLRILHQALDLK